MLEGWTPNQQSLNWSCIVHSWKCLFHLSALFYREPNNLCLLKMFSDLWFHCQLGKGFGSIHTSFRNRGPVRYNLVKLLLQCTNGTQTQTGGGPEAKGEGPCFLKRTTGLQGKIPLKGASLGAFALPGDLRDPGVSDGWVNTPAEMLEATTQDFTTCPFTPIEIARLPKFHFISSNLSYFYKYIVILLDSPI